LPAIILPSVLRRDLDPGRMTFMNIQVQTIAQSPFKLRYGNFIGGEWRDPVNGRYFDNITPVTGGKLCEVARSDEHDINLALDAAHAARTSGAGPRPPSVRTS
jgi:NAD-dependent aldehyde dehydrogenases